MIYGLTAFAAISVGTTLFVRTRKNRVNAACAAAAALSVLALYLTQ